MKLNPKIPNHTLLLKSLATILALNVTNSVFAQTESIVVTGSSIKRIDIEGALPIQSFNAEAIKQSGATNAAEFLQALPVMQGFTHSSESVGGGGAGMSTASIHDLGSAYTLVLLNGRRLAPANSGTTVDLNTIPLDAIERVEVLTDGASAIYGSDAIAGVVNFIMKKGKTTPLSISARADTPQHPGGKSKSFGISKGFGNFEDDGYSLFASYSMNNKAQLKASDREFAKTGILTFKALDKTTGNVDDMMFFNGSSRSIPANATAYFKTVGSRAKSMNPNYIATGQCPPAHQLLGTQCYFDYTSTVEIAPESESHGLFLNGKMKLGNSGFNLFSDLVVNKFSLKSKIAPYPAEFDIPVTSSLYSTYISPNLSAAQRADIKNVIGKYRLLEVGGRATDDNSTFTHWVGGLEGEAAGWDINSALTLSNQSRRSDYTGGWVLQKPFLDSIKSGIVDPFASSLSPAGLSALKAAQYNGLNEESKTKMTVIDAKASRPLFKLPAGTAYLAVGGDISRNSYSNSPTPVMLAGELLFEEPKTNTGYSRTSSGLFTELMAPLAKGWEVTGALRNDQVGVLHNDLNGQSIGKSSSDTTYKVSSRFIVNEKALLRGSFGTGFKAPTMDSLGGPKVNFGVSGGTYNCPLSGTSHPYAQYCNTSPAQLEYVKEGNPNLKPERSKQFTFGLVADPIQNVSFNIDYWRVNIQDAISSISETQIAANPTKYANLYDFKYKSSTGTNYLAFREVPVNLSAVQNAGVDWGVVFRNDTSVGRLTNRIGGTYLMKSRYSVPDEPGNWETSLGKYGSNNAVSFRNIINLSSSLQQDQWTHTVAANYRSGYKDIYLDAENCYADNLTTGDCADVQLRVKSYTTVMWRTAYRPTKKTEFVFSINNLFDVKPGLSLRYAGSHQLGYDPRYTDPYGRTLSVMVNHKFD